MIFLIILLLYLMITCPLWVQHSVVVFFWARNVRVWKVMRERRWVRSSFMESRRAGSAAWLWTLREPVRCRPSRVCVLSWTAQSLFWDARGRLAPKPMTPFDVFVGTKAGGSSCSRWWPAAPWHERRRQCPCQVYSAYARLPFGNCSVSSTLTSSLLTLTCSSSIILPFASMALCRGYFCRAHFTN